MMQRNTLTAQQRMARRQQAKEQRQAKQAVQKYSGLNFDYGLIEEQHRELAMQAALEIRTRHKRIMADTIAIGEALRRVKDAIPRGQFAAWIEAEFGYRRQWGYETINVADRLANCPIIGQISDSVARLIAAPSVPDEVINAVVEATRAAGKPLPIREVRAIRDAHMPPKPKQLPGPVAEPEQEPDAIDGEYEIAPVAPPVRSPQEIAADRLRAVGQLSLSECLMVLELAKEAAKRARELEPATYNIVTDMLPSISRLIHKIEQELRK